MYHSIHVRALSIFLHFFCISSVYFCFSLSVYERSPLSASNTHTLFRIVFSLVTRHGGKKAHWDSADFALARENGAGTRVFLDSARSALRWKGRVISKDGAEIAYGEQAVFHTHTLTRLLVVGGLEFASSVRLLLGKMEEWASEGSQVVR